MPIFRSRHESDLLARLHVIDKYNKTCQKLQDNWRRGWQREAIKGAIVVHQIPKEAIDACCDNDFKCWWFDLDIDDE